jgi:hypothetical protein
MSILARVKQVFRMCGHALNITVHERLDALGQEVKALQAAKLLESDAALLRASIHIIENLHALAGRTIVQINDGRTTPEAALIEFLYSHVPARTAIEINSSSRELTATLLQAGYEVYALESDRSGAKKMVAKMNGNASGMPGARGGSVAIAVAIPQAIGIAALGGNPVASIRELGSERATVVLTELNSTFEALVPEMRIRDYHWHLMLYRTVEADARPAVSYLPNHCNYIADTSGSVFFFRKYKTFAEAQAWCSAILPQTYVKPQLD